MQVFLTAFLRCTMPGDYSRLITYHKNRLDFPEDICLNLPLPDFSLARKWRMNKGGLVRSSTSDTAPFFQPHNIIEGIYFRYNDQSRKKKVEKAIADYALDSFDIIHYDGGLDLYRDSSQALKWKKKGKKIVCCYYGSDLRSRGLIRELDEISDLNITSEYDHLALKQDLHYLFYPYNPREVPGRELNSDGKLRIIHAPTNRQFKGTDLIIQVIEKLKGDRKFEFILLENVPRSTVLEQKKLADICIDQVGGNGGGTGYGKAGLESLAMGIPTITNMTAEYARWLPENPFVVANNGRELSDALVMLIDDAQLRMKKASEGIEWVKKYHGFTSVNQKLKELYRLKKII